MNYYKKPTPPSVNGKTPIKAPTKATEGGHNGAAAIGKLFQNQELYHSQQRVVKQLNLTAVE